MRMFRPGPFLAVVVAVTLALGASPAFAQAPASGPLVLRLPPSARTAALGGAWVAGRDIDVLFYNPAQIVNARPGFDLSITQEGPASHMGSIGSVYAAGKWSLTLAWGVQYVTFRADGGATYPYPPDVVLADGSANASSVLITVGGAIVYKGFRIGAAGKYAADSLTAVAGPLSATPVNPHAVLADLGVGRNLFGGVAALSVQNLGGGSTDDGASFPVPKQLLAGWSTTRSAGPLDLGVYTQIGVRDGWTAPAGGLEVGYSWIEGYNVALRVGARRPETDAQTPFAFGAAFTMDRLTVEYGVQLFDGGRAANGVTVRWR